MTSDVVNVPARLIKDFRKKHGKPLLKGAFILEDCYVGDEMLDSLVAMKSKEELVGDIIGLLQSPARNIISALQANADKKSETAQEEQSA
jgi:large subunit ribosomal protein L10